MIKNIFKPGGLFYGFRWFFWIAVFLMGTMIVSDVAGWRIFGGNGQKWAASGASGYHK